jgi:hypothetical protein
MTKTTNFRILNPVTATIREIAEVLNRAVDGKLNSVGTFTLPAGGGGGSAGVDVTVTDPRAGKESVILMSPIGTHFYNHDPYIKTKNNGSFVVGHSNHGVAVDVDYVIIG